MQQIIAMGGGGFSMEPDNPLLDHYILQASNNVQPKVCFIPTASGDSDNYIARFYRSFESLHCIPSHLSLFKPPTSDLASYALEKDILYVGGGNTKNLLALWKDWGLDKIMHQAWKNGIILAGISAGAICWFEEGLTDSYSGTLKKIDCLGFLPGSNCPHYDGELERKPVFHKQILSKNMKNGYAADDGVALHFIGTELHKVVSSRPHAKGFYVQNLNGEIVEEMLETTYLKL